MSRILFFIFASCEPLSKVLFFYFLREANGGGHKHFLSKKQWHLFAHTVRRPVSGKTKGVLPF